MDINARKLSETAFLLCTSPSYEAVGQVEVSAMSSVKKKVRAILGLDGWDQVRLSKEAERAQSAVSRWASTRNPSEPAGTSRDKVNALYSELIEGKPDPSGSAVSTIVQRAISNSEVTYDRETFNKALKLTMSLQAKKYGGQIKTTDLELLFEQVYASLYEADADDNE